MQTWKFFRSTTAMLLAGAMMTGAVSADWEVDPEISAGNLSGESGARNHVMENIAEYLYMFDYDMDNVSISEIYPIYTFGEADNDTGFYICYVFKDGEVIADLAISEKNGSYYSTFELCENVYADSVFENKIPISFAADGENLYMVSGENARVISSEIQNVGEIYSVSELNLPVITQSVMTASEIPQTCAVQASDDVITRNKYKVPIVGNLTIDDHGVCWAACVASKVMYQIVKYMNTNLTARDVYDAYMDKYGTIHAKRTRYINGLALYGIAAYDHSEDVILSEADLIDKAEGGDVTILRLEGGKNNHAVLFAGSLTTKTNSNTFKSCKYYIMEPNKTSYISISIDSAMYAGKKGFVYTASSGTVYTYIDSIYNS